MERYQMILTFIALAICCIFNDVQLACAQVTCPPGECALSVTPSVDGNAVPAELVWDGGVLLVLKATVSSFQQTSFSLAEEKPFFDDEFVELGAPVTDGTAPYRFNASRQIIFPSAPLQSNVTDEATVVNIRMSPARGFIASSAMTIQIKLDRFMRGGDMMRGYLDISPNVDGGGYPSFSILMGRNEFEIRRRGATVVIRLRYNVFKNQVPLISIDNYSPPLTSWTSQLSLNNTVMTLSLPPQPNFNITGLSNVTFRFTVQSNHVFLPIAGNSWVFSMPVAEVTQPLTYCRLDRTLIVENDLLKGPQYLVITLEDKDADGFDIGMPNFDALLIKAIAIPADSGVNITISDKNVSCVTVLFTANNTFDIFKNIYVYIAIPPILLLSKEAGCGGTTLDIAPSAGTVTGIGMDSLGLTELFINENTTRLRLNISKDLFVMPETTPHPIFIRWLGNVGTESTENSFNKTFMDVVAKTGRFEVGGGGTYADIVFPPNINYNIPGGIRERLAIVIPRSVVASGVTPLLQNVEFEIAGVEATFTVTFNGPRTGSVTIKELWNATDNLMVWFTIRGDRWNAAAADRWAYYHPHFYSTFFRDFHTVQRPVLDFSKVRISADAKIAFVPFLSVTNITTPIEERVFVNRIEILTEGASSAYSSFLILRTDRTSITGTYGGDAEDVGVTNPSFVTENDVRKGIVFNVTLKNQVFTRVNTTIFNARIFSNPSSLAPYIGLVVGTTDASGTVLTMRLPPLPAYDVHKPDGIGLRVPDMFFSDGVTPAVPIDGRINIQNLEGPTCSISVSRTITEIDVRERNILFNITANAPFAKHNLSYMIGNVTSSSVSGKVRVEPVGLQEPNTLVMRIIQNSTYDIVTSDRISINVLRFMFEKGEGCPGALEFDIAVQPATVEFHALPDRVMEEDMRRNSITSSFSVSNETVGSNSFPLQILTTKSGSARGLFNSFASVNVTAYRVGTTDTFAFTIPPLPNLDVYEDETFSIIVPTKVLASNRPATYVNNNTVTITPVSERIVIAYDKVVEEHTIVTGGLTFQFHAAFDAFTNASVIFDTLVVEAMDEPVPDPGFMKNVFNMKAVTLANGGAVMNITLPPFPSFNLLSGNFSVFFSIPANAMASRKVPIPNEVHFWIVSKKPLLRFSGSALYGGSRDLLMSSLELQIELINDRFTDSVDSSICHRQLQCVFVMTADYRHMTIQIRSSNEFTSIREVTQYTIAFPPSSFQNGVAPEVSSVQVVIYPQGGILEQVIDLTATYEESVFREGALSSFTLRVTGDEFVTDTNAIINSLISGVACTPHDDQFDFCSRLRNLINSVVISDNNRAATIMLQRDYDFDIYIQQSVVLQVTGEAFFSKQAPLARQEIAFTIYPTVGTVYYSNAAISVSASDIKNENSETPLDIAFTFTLIGERWAPDATTAILNSIGVTPTSQAFGFFNLRRSMFSPATISGSGRVAVLRMRPLSSFDIATAETLSINVNGDAVLSRLKPILISSNNQFVITVGGGALELLTANTYWAEDVAASGIDIRIQSSAVWDSLAISSGGLRQRGVFVSSSSIAAEPKGFARFSTYSPDLLDSLSMAPVLKSNIAPGDKVISISIPANPHYDLQREERIAITLPTDFQQGSNKGPFTPSTLYITVLPAIRDLLLLVANPVTAARVASKVATMLGIFVNRVEVVTISPYGDAQNLYSKVVLRIKDGSHVEGISSLSSAEATSRFFVATKSTQKSCCNVSAVYWASDPPTRDQSDIDLGLASPPERVVRSDDLLWVYVGLGALALVGVGALIWWKVYGAMMDSGRNRVRREEPDANTEPLLFIPKQGPSWNEDETHEMASRTAYRLLSVNADDKALDAESFMPRQREQHRLEGDTDEFTGHTLSLGGHSRRLERTGHKVTFDVDDHLHAGQPTHLLHESERLRENAQPRPAFVPPPMLPITDDDVVVYPQRYHDSPDYKRMRQHMIERKREKKPE